MPFRDKVKKAFGKSNDDPSETSSDLSPTRSKASTKKPKKQKVDYPDNVYKPGEIPESKYKGPYDKKHQQKLHAFSFAAAFQGRRKSAQSLYSPMGSRLPSRMGSLISRRSWVPRSRQQSRVDDTLMENSEADDAVENGESASVTLFAALELISQQWACPDAIHEKKRRVIAIEKTRGLKQ